MQIYTFLVYIIPSKLVLVYICGVLSRLTAVIRKREPLMLEEGDLGLWIPPPSGCYECTLLSPPPIPFPAQGLWPHVRREFACSFRRQNLLESSSTPNRLKRIQSCRRCIASSWDTLQSKQNLRARLSRTQPSVRDEVEPKQSTGSSSTRRLASTYVHTQPSTTPLSGTRKRTAAYRYRLTQYKHQDDRLRAS